MGIFPDAQGQVTPQSLVRSGRILKLRFYECSLTCKYEEDPIKNEGARLLTTFSHYNPMGAIRCHGQVAQRVSCLPWMLSLKMIKYFILSYIFLVPVLHARGSRSTLASSRFFCGEFFPLLLIQDSKLSVALKEWELNTCKQPLEGLPRNSVLMFLTSS